jgi:hypothetical protein
VRRLGLGPLTEAQKHLGCPNLFIRDNTLDIPGDIRRQTMI